MAPRLPAGALVVARALTAATPLHAGDVVVARSPDRPQLEIVKRIHSIDREGTIFLIGDNPNPTASTDSRNFGPLKREDIIALVRWRYWPLPPLRL
jgi:nickel-type superoxide dismutase maturation protease